MYQVFCKSWKSGKWIEYSKPYKTETEAYNSLVRAVNARNISIKDDHYIVYTIKEV